MVYDNLIINSNTCVGWTIYDRFIKCEYKSPLIGTLIIDDNDYISLIQDFKKTINSNISYSLIPKNNIYEKQTSNKYYKHSTIRTPYPIININNNDIHCIHENDMNKCIDKFKRRTERCKNILNNEKYKIINTMVFYRIY